MAIENLTREQEDKLSIYRERGIALGRAAGDTPLPSRAILMERFTAIYKEGGLAAPKTVVTLGSPHAGAIAAALFVMAKTPATLATYVSKDVDVQSTLDILRQQLDLPATTSKATTILKADLKIRDQTYTCGYGSHDSYWLVSYEFFYKELGVTTTPSVTPLIDGALDIGWYWPFANIVIVTPRPSSISLDEEGRLHKDGGPALTYPDGFSLYSLHGIRVPPGKERLVTAKASDLSAEDILMEPNADIRRELIRKVGPALLAEKVPFTVLHEATIDIDYNYAKDAQGFISRGKSVAIMKATMDMLGLESSAILTTRRSHPYQLIQFTVGENTYKALKMANPSIDATHIEFVSRTCDTVQDAIAFRASRVGGTSELPDGGIPVILT